MNSNKAPASAAEAFVDYGGYATLIFPLPCTQDTFTYDLIAVVYEKQGTISEDVAPVLQDIAHSYAVSVESANTILDIATSVVSKFTRIQSTVVVKEKLRAYALGKVRTFLEKNLPKLLEKGNKEALQALGKKLIEDIFLDEDKFEAEFKKHIDPKSNKELVP